MVMSIILNVFLLVIIVITSIFLFHYKDMSEKDVFTGCYNKNWFMTKKNSKLVKLMRKTQKDGRKPFGLIMIDMDNFKQYNDTKGHIAGDKLIIATVESIKKSIRNYDIVARVGGDELSIAALSVKTMSELDNIMFKIKKNVELETDRTISTGGVLYTKSMPLSVHCLLIKADELMYKDKGKNTVST